MCKFELNITIMKLNVLGLPVKETEVLVAELNILLSNFQVYYQNLRGLHWNIRGKRFFDLHVKFEELYNDSQLKIDLIAERVLTLGGTPLHTFDDYIKNSKLPIGKNIHNEYEFPGSVGDLKFATKMNDGDIVLLTKHGYLAAFETLESFKKFLERK